jgi:hypothetical protein
VRTGIIITRSKHCNCFVAFNCFWAITISVPPERVEDFPCMKNILDLEPISD